MEHLYISRYSAIRPILQTLALASPSHPSSDVCSAFIWLFCLALVFSLYILSSRRCDVVCVHVCVRARARPCVRACVCVWNNFLLFNNVQSTGMFSIPNHIKNISLEHNSWYIWRTQSLSHCWLAKQSHLCRRLHRWTDRQIRKTWHTCEFVGWNIYRLDYSANWSYEGYWPTR